MKRNTEEPESLLRFRILDKVRENEEQLKVFAFSWILWLVFDLGSTWPDARINPKELTDLLVRRGYAAADQLYALATDGIPTLGIHGEEEYIANRLNLLSEKHTKVLGKARISAKEHSRIHLDLTRTISDFSKRSSDNRESLKRVRGDFRRTTGLLTNYLLWDSKQSPRYVQQALFSRAVFNPMRIVFERLEDKICDYSEAQLAISIHKSGVASLCLWFTPRPEGDETALTADDLIELVEPSIHTHVKVAIPKDVSKISQEFIARYSMPRLALWRTRELDVEASDSLVYDDRLEVWEGSLSGLFTLYEYLIYTHFLEILGKRKNPDNLNRLSKAGRSDHGLLCIYDVGRTVEDPFEAVVKTYPRQISGILGGDRTFRTATSGSVRNWTVDTSEDTRFAKMISPAMSLTVYSTNLLEKELMPWQLTETIMDVANLEKLTWQSQLLNGYDALITEMLEQGVNATDLLRIEEKLTNNLEELLAYRHSRYYIREWWELAGYRMGIDDISDAVKQKLEQAHRVITTRTQEQTDKQLLRLTIILIAFTFLTVLVGIFGGDLRQLLFGR